MSVIDSSTSSQRLQASFQMLARALGVVSGRAYGSIFCQKLCSLVSAPYKMVENCGSEVAKTRLRSL